MRDIAKQDNLLLAYNRLLTNPESTYKNFFRDTYSAYGMAISKNIALLHKKVKSGYLPVDTVRVFMPKANGLSRMYTLMSIEDQIVYQAYANVLAEALVTNPKVKRRYKKSVFGNLYSNADSLFFYQKWQDSYKAYTKAIIKAYENGNKYIISQEPNPNYPGDEIVKMARTIYLLIPQGQAMEVGSNDTEYAYQMPIYSIILISVVNIGGIYLIRKKELK